ncbi:hypothetical protein KSZ28_21115 [Bacteroides salyersiae]|uniref:hypothetical protein n=1 Tax=Bacteroides TaxID=816 RepID=UPI00189D3AA5|nr:MULTISPECIES: hypothetical protein [Bacteroides]MBV4206203.1 hypothetical protein [Bacteroides salyersiae]MCB6651497.1 hypothetical protein [Bacteroides salyersiae]
MRKIILLIGLICLVVNILLGITLSSYSTFNMGLNCAVIMLNIFLLYILNSITLRDAFKISLGLLFSFFGLIEFILGLKAVEQFENNLALVSIIIIGAIEAILLVITTVNSKTIK